MVFRDILKEVVEKVDGALAASLMADDGIPVADYIVPDKENLNIQNLAIEFTNILKTASELAIEVLKGNVEELMLTTKDYSICFFPVHENYFVALLVKKNGNVGKGRYLMKLMRPKIVEQL